MTEEDYVPSCTSTVEEYKPPVPCVVTLLPPDEGFEVKVYRNGKLLENGKKLTQDNWTLIHHPENNCIQLILKNKEEGEEKIWLYYEEVESLKKLLKVAELPNEKERT